MMYLIKGKQKIKISCDPEGVYDVLSTHNSLLILYTSGIGYIYDMLKYLTNASFINQALDVIHIGIISKSCTNSDSFFLLTINYSLVQINADVQNIRLTTFKSTDRNIFIAASDYQCMAIVNNQLLDKTFKNAIYTFDSLVKAFEAGHDFFLVNLENGNVLSFGCGLRGQLGLGEIISTNTPQIVHLPEPILHIFCGGWHAFACTSDFKRIFTWGWNKWGQAGSKQLGFVQIEPEEFEDFNASEISLGSRHSLLKLNDTVGVFLGDNCVGQCGEGANEIVTISGKVLCKGMFTLVMNNGEKLI